MEWYIHLLLIFSFFLGTIHIAILNVKVLREQSKRALFFETIKLKKIDIIFAQETHTDADNSADWAKEFNGLISLSHHTTINGGVAILFSHNSATYSYKVDVIKSKLLQVRAQYEKYLFYSYLCLLPHNTFS